MQRPPYILASAIYWTVAVMLLPFFGLIFSDCARLGVSGAACASKQSLVWETSLALSTLAWAFLLWRMWRNRRTENTGEFSTTRGWSARLRFGIATALYCLWAPLFLFALPRWLFGRCKPSAPAGVCHTATDAIALGLTLVAGGYLLLLGGMGAKGGSGAPRPSASGWRRALRYGLATVLYAWVGTMVVGVMVITVGDCGISAPSERASCILESQLAARAGMAIMLLGYGVLLWKMSGDSLGATNPIPPEVRSKAVA